MGYELIYIDERAEWLEKAAAWFHQKWGILLEAYRESMEERGDKNAVPADRPYPFL